MWFENFKAQQVGMMTEKDSFLVTSLVRLIDERKTNDGFKEHKNLLGFTYHWIGRL